MRFALKLSLFFVTLLFSLELFSQSAQSKVLIPYRVKDLWGLSDTLGNVKVKPIFKEIKDFTIDYKNQFASRYVVKKDAGYFVIDEKLNVLLPVEKNYDSIKLFRDDSNSFIVYKNGNAGVFSKNKEIIKCEYSSIETTKNNSYKVSKGKFDGLINSVGKIVIPVEYLKIYPSWDEEDEKNVQFVWIAKGALVKEKFLDNRIVKNDNIELMYDNVKLVEEMTFDERVDNDFENSEFLKQFDEVIENRYSDWFVVRKKDKYGIASKRKKILVELKYDAIENFGYYHGQKCFKVKLNNKYGLVTEKNELVLPCEYSEIARNGKLQKDDKYGFILMNTIYKPIETKYNSIKSTTGIEISNRWYFGLFEVTTSSGKGLVGENGVEFFKD